MRISLLQLAWTICVGAVALAASVALHAADMQGAEIWTKAMGAESPAGVCIEDGGVCGAGPIPECGLGKLCYNLHHPVAIYHPEVYNYRYFFNIVGHESYNARPNCRSCCPSLGRSEEPLMPGQSRQQRLPAAIADAARATPTAQKNFQKY